MPRIPAPLVERRLWNEYITVATAVWLGDTENLADPDVSAQMGKCWLDYTSKRDDLGIVATRQGWKYQDEIPEPVKKKRVKK